MGSTIPDRESVVDDASCGNICAPEKIVRVFLSVPMEGQARVHGEESNLCEDTEGCSGKTPITVRLSNVVTSDGCDTTAALNKSREKTGARKLVNSAKGKELENDEV